MSRLAQFPSLRTSSRPRFRAAETPCRNLAVAVRHWDAHAVAEAVQRPSTRCVPITPDLTKNQTVSVSKAKKAIADYDKAIGRPAGLAELSIFYCEEAFSFVESCSFDDERYFIALIRMCDRSINCVLGLPLAERSAYVERLGKLRSRAKHVGWVVEDEHSLQVPSKPSASMANVWAGGTTDLPR